MKAEPESRVVRSEYADNRVKQPRLGADPGSIYGMKVTWSCDDPDKEGSWPSGTPRLWTVETWNTIIEPKLNEFSEMTWSQLEQLTSNGHRLHHSMETSRILPEAQERLKQLGKHRDTIYRFRLSSLERLWGMRTAANFEVLWYDPFHEIYKVGD